VKGKWFWIPLLAFAGFGAFTGLAAAPAAHAVTLPPGNAALQWNKIAEDTAVGAGAFQGEAFLYLAYVSAAMDRAVNPGERNGQSADAAVAQAAHDVLVHYFPAKTSDLDSFLDASLAGVPDDAAKRAGIKYGGLAADKILRDRAEDGLQTPIASTSPFPTLPFGPGVWRLTPNAATPPVYAAPQTPWIVHVRPWVLRSPDQFMPPPPPSLQSDEWVDAFNEVKSLGAKNSVARTAEQTTIANFYAANVNRQWGMLTRNLATSLSLDVPESARFFAMIDVTLADTCIAWMNAKYHYLFWRPVTAIDPTSVTGDGFGPVPGFDDGNPATIEQPGWRPLLATPNHPEYPSAHSTFTSAVAEVLTRFLGTPNIDVDIQGMANFSMTRHFDTADQLRADVGNARVWAGLHYRFSVNAGAELGREVADYDLDHAFSTGG
jgi:hypothetical protein